MSISFRGFSRMFRFKQMSHVKFANTKDKQDDRLL